WLEERAEMDKTCGVDSSQPTELPQVDAGGGQVVRDDSSAPLHSAEDEAAWDGLIAHFKGETAIRRVDVEVCLPDAPPHELSYEREEELEAEAIRDEGCGVL